VVRKNLTNSFPDKPEKEIQHIEKKFYRHLCDYFVETIKTLRLSDEEVRKRMKFENLELITELTKNGQPCFACTGHYGNWEWIPSISADLGEKMVSGLIYRRLKSVFFDHLFLDIRSRFGALPIEKDSALRKIIKLKNDGKTLFVGFLADQRPSKNQDGYWTTFLHQDTLVQTGVERIAHLLKCPVVYLDIAKVKRGYYTGTFSVITMDASKEKDFFVLEQYMRKLEETILKEPAYYLWSHNRWKFKKKEA
jgi:KDO2-lipid IV(A) lauroyltransferase